MTNKEIAKIYLRAIATVLAIITFVGSIFYCEYKRNTANYENQYGLAAQVVDIEPSGTYVVEDKSGNLWAFDGGEYFIHEVIQLTMDSKGTSEIEDDEIINISDFR